MLKYFKGKHIFRGLPLDLSDMQRGVNTAHHSKRQRLSATKKEFFLMFMYCSFFCNWIIDLKF